MAGTSSRYCAVDNCAMDEPDQSGVSDDPELEAQLHIDAWRGLERADLAPLVRLLRSEFVLNEYIALDIADAIEGKNPDCRITAKKVRAGRPSADREVASLRDGKIALFVAERTERSAYEGAVREAMDQFGLSRTGVTDAVRAARNYRQGMPEKLHSFWDGKCKAALERELARG